MSPAPDGEVDDAVVLKALRALIPYAEEKGVTLLVETNGVYADTSRLAGLLNQIESDNIGALWDMHHPYRYGNERPSRRCRTWERILNTPTSRIPSWKTAG